jgi:lysophospholipase L1-like esterase
LDYSNAPFAIADNAFAGKKLHSISLPVYRTGKLDEEGMLTFTLYVLPNTYNALVSSRKTDVTEYEIKLKPKDYDLEENKKNVFKYVTVDLTEYKIELSDTQTLAFGKSSDSIQIASMLTSKSTAKMPQVITDWREEWLITGYHANLFSGSEGKDAGGLFYDRDSIPIDFVFDYGSADAKAEVIAAREREAAEYAEKLAAVKAAYQGKYLSLIGDSISSFRGVTDNIKYNDILTLNRSYYSANYLNDYTQMYWGRLAEDTEMELCVINGWSSSKVYGGGQDKNNNVDATKDNMLVRSTELHNKAGQTPDVILLYLGINDVSYKNWSDLYDRLAAAGGKTKTQVLGEWMEGVNATYEAHKESVVPGVTYESWEASYALSLAQMRAAYPNAEIYIINLTRSHHGSGTEEKIAKANTCLAALAEYFGVDVIDQANSEVNYANCHLYGADENDPVGLHPNIRGHAALTKVIVETLYEKLPK